MSNQPLKNESPYDLKAMLQTGVVDYAELLIDRPVEAVWAVLPEYHQWSVPHRNSKRRTIKGEPGMVGETVEILKAGARDVVCVETLRIRPLAVVAGAYKAGNIAFKVYAHDYSFSRFSDLGVRECAGGTILHRWAYTQLDPVGEEFQRARRGHAEGKDYLNEFNSAIKGLVEAFIDTRAQAASSSALRPRD